MTQLEVSVAIANIEKNAFNLMKLFHKSIHLFSAYLIASIAACSIALAGARTELNNTTPNKPKTEYYLQVGAFQQDKNAKQLMNSLNKQLKLPVDIDTDNKVQPPLYKVEVGPLNSMNLVARVESQLEQMRQGQRKRQLPNAPIDTTQTHAKSKTKKPSSHKPNSSSSITTAKPINKPVTAATPTSTIASPNIVPQNNPVSRPPRYAHKTPSRLWNLRNADIRSVIAEVSRETGKNFIVDPRVQGKISIYSSKPLHPAEVYKVFLAALQVSGFAAVNAGKVIKIVPSINAKTLAAPIGHYSGQDGGDEMVVQVVPIKFVSAEQLVPVLRPLLPEWSTISAYSPANTLILSGRASNIHRIVQIIHRVDTSSSNGYDVIPLRYASADEIVKTVNKLLSGASKTGLNHEATLSADERSNTVIVGGTGSARLRAKILIAQLDTGSQSGSGNTQIIYLRYLQAKTLVPILAGVAKANYNGPVETVIGARAITPIPSGKPAGYDSGSQQGDDSSGSSTNTSSASQQRSTQATTTMSQANPSGKPIIEIIAEPNSNAILLNAPNSVLRILTSVIHRLDVRPKQVLVQAIIAEINAKDLFQLGLDWGSRVITTDSSGNVSSAFRSGVAILNSETRLKNFQAVLTALAKEQRLDILSTPTIVVLNNHEAKILVGKEVSIEDSTYPNNAGGTTVGTPYTTFTRRDVALHLYVTPQINRGNGVQLQINQGNDTLQNPTDTSGRPVFNKSSITTSVIVNSGDILVLGGLVQNSLENNHNYVPILGQLPIVRKLFQDNGNTREKKVLMVFLRPLILRTPLDGLSITQKKYHKLREQQLAWLRTIRYNSKNQQLILKPLKKPALLPMPYFHEPQ